MKKIYILFVVILFSCKKERTCECQTVVTDKITGQRLLDGKQQIVYEGTKQDCENIIVVDSYTQKIEIICNVR